MIALEEPAILITRTHNLLASAIAGRRVNVGSTAGGALWAYVAGDTIFIPARKAPHAFEDGFTIVCQALLVGAGSLRPALLRRLIGRPVLARRFAWLEVCRAAQSSEMLLPVAFSHYLALHFKVAATSSSEHSLELARTGPALDDIPDFVGTVHPVGALRARAMDKQPDFGTDPLRLRAAVTEASRDTSEDQETETSSLLEVLENPIGGHNSLADLLHSITGARRVDASATRGAAGSAVPTGGVERTWRNGIHAIRTRLSAQIAALLQDIGAGAGAADALYPEWDVHAKRMRPEWVSLREVDPWRPDGAGSIAGLRVTPPAELARHLSRLGLATEMHRRQTDGTDLDTGALAEYAVDRRLGQGAPAPAIFRSSRKTRRELGVVLMLDLSASTEDQDARGASVFQHQLEAACDMVASFDRIGVRVEFLGFHSKGRHAVHAVRLKPAGESWGAAVLDRCAQLDPSGYTRTGTAIRHSQAVLQKRLRLQKRLLILISDGFPYDQDYEGAYAEADTRVALAEARACGTAVVCICIGGTTEVRTLRAVFGGANILSLDTVAGLTTRIAPLCHHALAAVALRTTGR